MSFRTTLLSCLTALACVAMVLVYAHRYLRYQVVGGNNAVFVLDRQTTLMHHCDQQHCQIITPQGTNLDAMRQLAGIPTAQEVIKKPQVIAPQTCRCENEKVETLPISMKVSSFQTLEPQILSPERIRYQQKLDAQKVNMPVMMELQNPQRPFPSDNFMGNNNTSSMNNNSAGISAMNNGMMNNASIQVNSNMDPYGSMSPSAIPVGGSSMPSADPYGNSSSMPTASNSMSGSNPYGGSSMSSADPYGNPSSMPTAGGGMSGSNPYGVSSGSPV